MPPVIRDTSIVAMKASSGPEANVISAVTG